MRSGRLAVYSGLQPDGKRILGKFVVVPDDGSEPVELRVNRATVSGKVGEAVTAVVRCYVCEIQLEDPTDDIRVSAVGGSVSGTAPGVVTYPHVNMNDGAFGDVRSFLWRFRAGSFGRIVLSRLTLDRRRAA